MAAHKRDADTSGPVTIKKYANRRLYNTSTSSYVTLDHLCQMVKDGIDFAVYDAKSGADITRSVLTQIIVEEEAKGQNLLPINFLRQLISFYGDSLQWVVPSYLEHMMSNFSTNQDSMRRSMQETFGGMFPFNNLEEVSRQNLALFESAVKMFAPFGETPGGTPSETAKAPPGTPPAAPPAGNQAALTQLQMQVDLLQKQLQVLSQSGKKDS